MNDTNDPNATTPVVPASTEAPVQAAPAAPAWQTPAQPATAAMPTMGGMGNSISDTAEELPAADATVGDAPVAGTPASTDQTNQ